MSALQQTANAVSARKTVSGGRIRRQDFLPLASRGLVKRCSRARSTTSCLAAATLHSELPPWQSTTQGSVAALVCNSKQQQQQQQHQHSQAVGHTPPPCPAQISSLLMASSSEQHLCTCGYASARAMLECWSVLLQLSCDASPYSGPKPRKQSSPADIGNAAAAAAAAALKWSATKIAGPCIRCRLEQLARQGPLHQEGCNASSPVAQQKRVGLLRHQYGWQIS